MYLYIIIINEQQHPQIRHVITGLSRRGRANKQARNNPKMYDRSNLR